MNTVLYEEGPFYVSSAAGRLEIRLCSSSYTYAVVVGKVDTLDEAKRVIGRLSRYVDNVRRMYQCY